jgi:hypothetical protein
MPKSPKVKKESSKREQEEGRTSEEDTNPFKKRSRKGRSPSISEEGNKSKEMEKEMTTIIRQIRDDTEGEQSTKKGISSSNRGEGELRK